MMITHAISPARNSPPDLDAVVDRARAGRCRRAVHPRGRGRRRKRSARGGRAAWPAVRFSAGIHPHQAGEFAATPRCGDGGSMRSSTTSTRRALGEIGLDYHYDFSPRHVSRRCSARRSGSLASAACRSSFTRASHRRHVPRSCEEERRPASRCVPLLHRRRAMARAALDLGFHLSFAGIVTFPEGREAARGRAAGARRPLPDRDRCPYLAPVPFRGKRNEPAFVAQVETLATPRGPAARVAEPTDRSRAGCSRTHDFNPRRSNGLAR